MNPSERITAGDYSALLQKWLARADDFIHSLPGRPRLECWGTGYDGWGVQTHQKAFASYAAAATLLQNDRLLQTALRLLRFNLESHIEGKEACTDGKKWGHTWISALGIERMFHGIESIWDSLGEEDIGLLRKVLLSECDWLMDGYFRGNKSYPGEIRAGVVENNHPENNIWNGALLHRTAMLFPDAPRAGEYREKGTRFLLNGISTEKDALSKKTYEGKPLKDWHAGANFFDTYALNHHRYLNVGYMAICLSNIAMLHFSFKRKMIKPPEALYHNAAELWKLVKLCTFPDGRLLRTGGDTRVRYCYCQDYCVPVWLMAEDVFGDRDCPEFEKRWLETVSKEQDGNGSFLSTRCAGLKEISPLYYTRLESDRAASLSMGACWRSFFSLPESADSAPKKTSGSWHDPYHGAYLIRTPERIASWTWRAAEPPQGLCLPPEDSSMAEWMENLAGSIKGTGRRNSRKIISHGGKNFAGGFLTWGISSLLSEEMIAEGQPGEDAVVIYNAFAALPDNATVLSVQKAAAPGKRVYVRSIKGIHLLVPNDIFNGGIRRYASGTGVFELNGNPGKEKIINLGPWVNIDGNLSVVKISGDEDLTIFRPAARHIGLKTFPAEENPLPGGMLYADEICSPCVTGIRDFNPCESIYETSFMVRAGMNAQETERYAKKAVFFSLKTPGGVHAAGCEGADGVFYALVSNFGEKEQIAELELPGCTTAKDAATGEEYAARSSGRITVKVKAGEAVLLRASQSGS